MICKYRRISLILIIIMLGISNLSGNVLVSSAEENNTVKVGFYKWDGFNDMNEDGNLSGYGYEYLEHLSRYSDLEFEFVGYEKTWQESMDMLKDGEIDLLCSMIKTPEREREFLLSDYPMGSKKYVLTSLNTNDNYYLGDTKELNGIRIGVYKDNASNAFFEEFASDNNIEYSFTSAPGKNEDEWLIDALNNREIDGIFSSEYRITENEKIILSTGSTDFYIAVNKENDKLMESINASMKELNGNEPLFCTELTRKYFANAQLGHPNFTREESEFINKNSDEIIRLGVYNNNPPFYWIENEVDYGIYVEICKIINELTGLNIELSDGENVEGMIGVPSDLYMGRTMGLEISDPILEYNYAEVYYDNSDFKRVGILDNHNSNKEVIGNIYQGSQLISYESFEKIAYAIEHRNIEAIFVDELSAQVIINQIYSNNINIYTYGNLDIKESIGIKENAPKELLTIINKCIYPWVREDIESNIGDVLYEATDDYNSYDFWTSYRQAISVFAVMFILAYLVLRKVWIINRDRLEAKNKELVKANAAKSDFLGRMSHDMRTPMNAIIGMSEFGVEEIDDGKAKEYFGNIKHSSLYLLALLNDVLDIQRIEQGAVDLQNKWTDFSSNYEMIVNNVKDRAQNKDIELELYLDDKLKNAKVFIDSIRFRQIILNLINNSIKYTPKGGKIRVSFHKRDLNEKSYIVSMISDNGVGMSESFMEKMYDKFAQEENSESKEEGGTGLGLSITKNLVELMSGEIKCSSKLNEGTTFTVKIPVEINKGDYAGEYQDELDLGSLTGKEVLLCEDNNTNAMITIKLLEKIGIKVDLAQNGSKGIEMAKSFKYDAILMDIRMPVVDGIEASKAIREFDKVVPIIALSANAYEEDIDKSIKAGMQGHIPKPINRDELYQALIKYVK